MMTIDRFKTLAGSYGARLEIWPAAERAAAEVLLGRSAEARRLLAEARPLDEAVALAGSAIDRSRAPAGGEAAALARLRAGVAGRIAALPARSPSWPERLRRALAVDLGTVGFATGGGLVLAAGLLIGWLQGPAAPATGLMSLLQAAPIQILAE